jgi:hypothetical protein
MNTFTKILIYSGIFAGVILIIAFVVAILKPPQPIIKYASNFELYSKTKLNIRNGPGTEWKIIKTLNPNDKILTYDTLVDGFTMVLNVDSTKFGWTAVNYLQSTLLSKKQLEDIEKRQIEAQVKRTEEDQKKSNSEKIGLPEGVEIQIIKADKNPNISKASYDFRINKKVDEEILNRLASYYKSQFNLNAYDRIFMLYYLSDM